MMYMFPRKTRKSKYAGIITVDGLTAVEQKCLEVVLAYFEKEGEYPSFRNIQSATGFALQTVQLAIKRLAELGHVRKSTRSGSIIWAALEPVKS